MRAQRNLVGGIPGVRIGHRGRRKTVDRGALAETQQAGELVHVIRRVPRAVISVHLAGIEQRAAAEFCRAHAEIAQIVEAADGGFRDGLVDAVAQIDEQRARGGEIADIGEVRSLADVQAGDRLRHQPVEVGVALAVSMGRQIDRHVVDEDRQIRAVIEIVAAQIILIGLAAVGVHDHGEAGHGFENLARSRHRAGVELLPGHRHLARHGGRHGGAAGNVRRAGDIRQRRRRLRTRRCGWSRGWLRRRGMWLVVFGGHLDRRELRAVRQCGYAGGDGGVCAWAFTHKSDSITAIDAKKSDSIAAPEPDDGSPTYHPHHETVSMMLSIKVHTSELPQTGRCDAQTLRGGTLGATRCGMPP